MGFGKTEYMAGSNMINIDGASFYMSTNASDPMKIWISHFSRPRELKCEQIDASVQIEKTVMSEIT